MILKDTSSSTSLNKNNWRIPLYLCSMKLHEVTKSQATSSFSSSILCNLKTNRRSQNIYKVKLHFFVVYGLPKTALLASKMREPNEIK